MTRDQSGAEELIVLFLANGREPMAAIRNLLAPHTDIRVIGGGATPAATLNAIGRMDPKVVLMDCDTFDPAEIIDSLPPRRRQTGMLLIGSVERVALMESIVGDRTQAMLVWPFSGETLASRIRSLAGHSSSPSIPAVTAPVEELEKTDPLAAVPEPPAQMLPQPALPPTSPVPALPALEATPASEPGTEPGAAVAPASRRRQRSKIEVVTVESATSTGDGTDPLAAVAPPAAPPVSPVPQTIQSPFTPPSQPVVPPTSPVPMMPAVSPVPQPVTPPVSPFPQPALPGAAPAEPEFDPSLLAPVSPLPSQPAMDDSLVKQLETEAPPPPLIEPPSERAPCRVVAVYSGKGGVGTSTVAANLAVAISLESGDDVGLIDLDLQFGDLHMMLGVHPRLDVEMADLVLPATFTGVVHLIGRAGQLSKELVDPLFTHGPGKTYLLAAPINAEEADACTGQHVSALLLPARDLYPHVIIDCSSYLNEPTLVALDEADEIVLVSDLSIASIKDLKVVMRIFESLPGGMHQKVRLVINRADKVAEVTVDNVEQAIGIKAIAQIPTSDFSLEAANKGVPLIELKPAEPMSRRLRQLGRYMSGLKTEAEAPAKKGRGLRLIGR